MLLLVQLFFCTNIFADPTPTQTVTMNFSYQLDPRDSTTISYDAVYPDEPPVPNNMEIMADPVNNSLQHTFRAADMTILSLVIRHYPTPSSKQPTTVPVSQDMLKNVGCDTVARGENLLLSILQAKQGDIECTTRPSNSQ